MYAATRLVDIPEMRRVAAFRRSEAALLVASFGGVVLFDLLVGIGIAVGLSITELFARIAAP